MAIVANSGRRLLRLAADGTLCGPTWRNVTPLATRPWLLPVWECETIYRLICDSPSATGNSNDEWKHLFEINWPRRIVAVCLFAHWKYFYLLTYMNGFYLRSVTVC